MRAGAAWIGCVGDLIGLHHFAHDRLIAQLRLCRNASSNSINRRHQPKPRSPASLVDDAEHQRPSFRVRWQQGWSGCATLGEHDRLERSCSGAAGRP